LSTISTAGKVSNSATTATNANTVGAIVSRDGSGNFLANNITANLIGSVSGNVLGDVKGSVFGDDSTKIIDAVESKVYGGFVGSLNGNRVTLDQSLATTGFIIYSEASGGAGDIFNINTYHSSADPSLSIFSRSRGTFSAPTPLLDADLIYGLAFSGRSSDGTSSITAAFGAGVAGTPAPGILPGNIIFSTNTVAGSLTPKLIIGPDGLQTVVAPALVAGASSGQVNTGSITSWMKVNFNGVEYAVPMYAIRP
jgi:hypothetical protein